MMNPYYAKTLDFQAKLKEYASTIFCTYGKELELSIAEFRLLQDRNNRIEGTKAIELALEEFIVSKLETYTHCVGSEYVIDRFADSAASGSFDCFSVKDGMKFMVNVKAEKAGQQDEAVAPSSEGSAEQGVELKIVYSLRDAYRDAKSNVYHPRHIYIEQVDVREQSSN